MNRAIDEVLKTNFNDFINLKSTEEFVSVVMRIQNKIYKPT